MQLILGSASPRRQAMLEQHGIPFTIRIPNIDESSIQLTNPKQKVETLARLKARAIPLIADNEIILAADTIVAYEGTIYEKPHDQQEAYEMITSLSGTKHEVITAFCLRSRNQEVIFSVQTDVHFWNLTDTEIKAYIATNEPYDKAGAYGIQGRAALFVKKIDGDYFNVVGLPISYVIKELRRFDFPVDQYIFTQ